MKTFMTLVRLAYQDLLFDKKIALCIIFSLVSVIAPLLLLFGLKHGIITQLNQQLLSDPRNLEIVVLGNKNYSEEWIDNLSFQKEVEFVIPLTRSLNAQADFVNNNRYFIENVEIIPTANGDPLLAHQSRDLDFNEVILSSKTAQTLNIQKGETIKMIISRKVNNQLEKWNQEMKVVDTLETNYFNRSAAFISLETLIVTERYKDGDITDIDDFLTDHEKVSALIKDKKEFAKFRLFASSLDDVNTLANMLLASNIETTTRQADIANVQAISYVLNIIFSVIAWITFIGCVASLTGAFLANIDRKRKDLAVLRLLGFSKKAVGFYILLQAAMMTTVGFALACALYYLGSYIFNSTLGAAIPQQGFVSVLTGFHLLIALSLSLLLSISVALIGVYRASRILPAESLREL
ncbi:ABC transporter permease [Thorsellia kenyensis]|uniref:ABC transporter permease n=1 Tax=Thorsellia kenyensis TaxID=1549888 RepID=A0ABV6CA50_9GAMM